MVKPSAGIHVRAARLHPSGGLGHGCSEIQKGFFKGRRGGGRARAGTHAPVGNYMLALVGVSRAPERSVLTSERVSRILAFR